ncbi:F-box protein [Trifolium medium]|uniref:F-box protein n=1 Tax=Trifolium medium TaxID=97028 RepID=A0A392M509_9FABA|nr:F-box protein [Trifolium medium]
MADWSQLPKDLLQLISQRLDSELYLLRFRSVCSTWRSSSSIPKHHPNYLSLKLPEFYNNDPNPPCHISKHNIFLIKPPQHQQTLHHRRPWLIRIGPDPDGKIQLWHPFSLRPHIPFHFPHHVLDFNQLSVFHLGHLFLLSEANRQIHSAKLLVAPRQEKQPLFMVTFNCFGELTLFRCGDERWTIIQGMATSAHGDICIFKGRPCAVDYDGYTVMFEPDLSHHLIAEPLLDEEGVHTKFLLQSECELLLVDCYACDSGFSIKNGDVRIAVFRLDEKEKKWVKLTSLGDRVLFLGNRYMFSASASELGFAKGNCVIYTDDVFKGLDDMEYGMSVFQLDQNRVSPLSDYPDYLKLFWPPPEWIAELHS